MLSSFKLFPRRALSRSLSACRIIKEVMKGYMRFITLKGYIDVTHGNGTVKCGQFESSQHSIATQLKNQLRFSEVTIKQQLMYVVTMKRLTCDKEMNVYLQDHDSFCWLSGSHGLWLHMVLSSLWEDSSKFC